MADVRINNNNLYTFYGSMLVKGAYNALRMQAEKKDYITNESRLTNGKEYILTEETDRYKEREVTFSFLITSHGYGYDSNLSRLESAIMNGFFTLYSSTLSQYYRLLYKSSGAVTRYKDSGVHTYTFVEPDPTDRGSTSKCANR